MSCLAFKAKWAKVRVIPTAHIDEVRMMKHQEKYGPHSEMPMMDVGRGMIGNGHQKVRMSLSVSVAYLEIKNSTKMGFI